MIKDYFPQHCKSPFVCTHQLCLENFWAIFNFFSWHIFRFSTYHLAWNCMSHELMKPSSWKTLLTFSFNAISLPFSINMGPLTGMLDTQHCTKNFIKKFSTSGNFHLLYSLFLWCGVPTSSCPVLDFHSVMHNCFQSWNRNIQLFY